MSYQMTELIRPLTTSPNGDELNPTEKLVLILLATYYNETDGYAFPSLTRLANEAAVSRSQVIKVLKRLESIRCIVKEKRMSNSTDGHYSNRYFFEPAFLSEPECRAMLPRAQWAPPKKKDKGASRADATSTPQEEPSEVAAELVAPAILASRTEDDQLVAPARLPSRMEARSSRVGATLNGTLEYDSPEGVEAASKFGTAQTTSPPSSKKQKGTTDEQFAWFFHNALGRDPTADELADVRTLSGMNKDALSAALDLAKLDPSEEGQSAILRGFIKDPALGFATHQRLREAERDEWAPAEYEAANA